MADKAPFAAPGTAAELEEGAVLTPKFDADGLVTCVATDACLGDVLMVAHMNAEALAKTIENGEAWFYSRSRAKLWKKGETSGHVQRVVEMRIDCDQDAVWIKVEQVEPAPATPAAARVFIARCRSARPARSRSNFATIKCLIRRRPIRAKPISPWALPGPTGAWRAPDAGGRT